MFVSAPVEMRRTEDGGDLRRRTRGGPKSEDSAKVWEGGQGIWY
uniref:Uncharacterized protein n=1 Tax=Arundo donax TaxID=35708 RepID=A0A0A9AS03_ARUDO